MRSTLKRCRGVSNPTGDRTETIGEGAVFLDRDGTIARDVHYCRRPEDLEILPTVPEAIALLNRSGFRVVIVTNQSGVGRGYFSEETLLEVNRHMRQELALRGASIDEVYYCPHHPDDGCGCRKPNPGLILKAAADLGIDPKRSFVVGDSERDIAAGKAAGCRTALVTNGRDPKSRGDLQPDCIAKTLLQAVEWMLNDAGGRALAVNRTAVSRKWEPPHVH